MPRYAKKTTSRKRVYKRKTYKPTAYKLARRALSYAKPEVKEKVYPYTSIGGASLSSISYGSGAITAGLCEPISQGVLDGQRIGNRIKLIGMKIDLAAGAGDNYNNLRLIIVRAKRSGYPATSVADLVQNILSGTPSGSTQWLAPIDTDRYHVLYDARRVLRYTALNGTSNISVPTIAYFRKFLKMRRNIQWDDSGYLTDGLTLLAISDSDVIAHPGMIAGHIKLYYTDV